MIRQVKNRIREKGPAQKLRIRAGGQVVLMVLLASALILTLGLSASRITTTETRIDTDQELLKQAFNMAESGIDYYMVTGETNYETDGGSGAADLKVSGLGNDKILGFNSMVLVGNYEYFWLVDHESDGDVGRDYYSSKVNAIDICGSNNKVTSFKVDYFYLTGGNYKVERKVIDTGSDGCIAGFDIAEGGNRSSLLLTVMPIETPNKIELKGRENFPIQGEQISATGKVEGVNNTVTVLNRYSVDTFLTEAVVSGGNVSSK